MISNETEVHPKETNIGEVNVLVASVATHGVDYDDDDDAKKRSICEKARRLWLQPVDTTSMNQAEVLYRGIWSSRRRKQQQHLNVNTIDSVDNDDNHASKKCKIVTTASDKGIINYNVVTNTASEDVVENGISSICSSSIDWVRRAGEKLALILLQSGRNHDADQILIELDYTCRLSNLIMNYDYSIPQQQSQHDVSSEMSIPCQVYDNYVTDQNEMKMFQTVFIDQKSPYWTFHKYSVEPPSPYFSHLIPLQRQKTDNSTNDSCDDDGIFAFVHRLQTFLQSLYPIKNATHCEMWAHSRYHATGHQFHFDSDNEGCTETIRNPICSCIVYLSDDSVGGPSIVTNQRVSSNHLATKGWMCHPKFGRLVVFDGKVLHGVVPGKDSNGGRNVDDRQQHRRVSVMFAFWRTIRVRDSHDGTTDTVGAARTFPETPLWAQQLRKPRLYIDVASATTTTPETTTPSVEPIMVVDPMPLDHIYVSTKNGRPWTRNMGMPNYEEIYQGF